MNGKKIFAIFVIIIAAALGLYFLFLILAKPEAINEADKTVESKSAASATRFTEAETGELARNFPKAIPLYGQEKIIKSYGASQPGAANQAITVFQSAKSTKDNYNYYVNWAKDNEWQIINQADDEALKFVYLRKSGQDINLTITKYPDSAETKVSLSWTKF